MRSQKSEDAAIAGSHQSSFYTYEDYGGWNIFKMQIFQANGFFGNISLPRYCIEGAAWEITP